MARRLEVEIVGDTRKYERALKDAGRDTQRFDRQISKTFRGAAAGSGIFKSLGRSLAFASGGFIAAASVTDVLRGSITQATEAAKVQGQLAAQFKASGQNLSLYQDQIDETSNRLSVLAGIENDELKAAFVTAFRGTENVSSALKIQAIAADVARARGISLATATLALTKAYGGQSTALRRLGVLVPAALHGMSALNFVQEKFAGQAKAGTTVQERFTAAIKNMEEAVGTALLPTFNKLLRSATKWLGNAENQRKVQEDVESVVRTSATAFGLLADAIGKTSSAYKFLTNLPGGKKGLIDLLPGGHTSLLDIIHRIRGKGGGDVTPVGGTADRVPGRAPTGAGAFQAIQAVTAATKRHASLAFQMSMLQEQLAKAELTASQRDDRAVLVRTANLIRRRIVVTKDLHDRTALYESLGSVEQQILQIDAKAAADRTDAQEKQKAARQKELDAAKKAAEAAKEHAAKLRALEKQRQQRALARLTASQFRQLGLGPSGADVIPSGKELIKRLGKVKDQVKGTVLDTKENRKLLERIRHTLVDGLGKLAPEVRSKIDQLLDALDIEDAAKKRGKKPFDFGRRDFGHGFGGLPEFMRSGLTRLGTPAGMPIPRPLTAAQLPARLQVNTMNVHLHGVQNVRQLEDELAKRTKARAHTRRGP